MVQPIEIYQSQDGQTQVEVRFEQETVWLSQAQMVELFGRDVSVISRHIRNAITEGEVDEKSNLQKMQIASADRPVIFWRKACSANRLTPALRAKPRIYCILW